MPTEVGKGSQIQSKGKKKSNKNKSNPPKPPKVSYYCSCKTCNALFPYSKEEHDRIAHGPYATHGKPYLTAACARKPPLASNLQMLLPSTRLLQLLQQVGFNVATTPPLAKTEIAL